MGLIYAVNPGQDGVEYRPLLNAQLVLVCNKTLARAIKSRPDLERLVMIEAPPSSLDWDVWSQQNKYRRREAAQVARFDSLLLAIEAALNGLGVLVIPEFIVRDDLRSGRLVSPLGRPAPQLGQWYLAYNHARKFDKPILAFEKWLKSELRGPTV
jgi:LysR family glycine cleavage system transcriptional activator